MNEEEEFEFRARMEQEAGAEAPSAEKESPSYLAVAGNAAAKGAASFGDMFLNAPVNAYNVAKAGVVAGGDALGMDLRDNLEITPQPNLLEKGMRATGLISDDREPVTPGQRILDLATQAGTTMIGNPLRAVGLLPKVAEVTKSIVKGFAAGGAGGITKEVTGSDVAATAVTMATPLAARGIPSKANAPILRNPVLKKTAEEGMAAGLKIPPSAIKPSFTTNRLQGFAGKAATDQEAQVRNVEAIDNLARKAIGVQEGQSIQEGIAQARAQAGKAYEDIAKLSPGGELRNMNVTKLMSKAVPEKVIKSSILDERGSPIVKETIPAQPSRMTGLKSSGVRSGLPLDELKQARADSTTYFKHYNVSKDPKSLKQAKAFRAIAERIEDDLERRAIASGQPELVENFRQARTLYAKTYDIERALNTADDHVSAAVLGRMFAKKHPLSGELAVIGKFAKAFPKAVRDGAMIQSPGVSGVEAMAAGGLGALGYGAAGGPVGLLAAGIPMLRGPARSMLLSKGYQGRLLKEAQSLTPAVFQSVLGGRAIAEAK